LKVSFAPFAGLSLDLLKEIKPNEADMVEFVQPEMVIEITPELFDAWVALYNSAIIIGTELEEIHRKTHGGR
jgi:hypothetical protein